MQVMKVLPIFVATSLAVSVVDASVCRAGMISISFIIGTGLKKCMPTNFPGRLTRAAISVMAIEEVFVA